MVIQSKIVLISQSFFILISNPSLSPEERDKIFSNIIVDLGLVLLVASATETGLTPRLHFYYNIVTILTEIIVQTLFLKKKLTVLRILLGYTPLKTVKKWIQLPQKIRSGYNKLPVLFSYFKDYLVSNDSTVTPDS